jgi:transcriptional regulator with PAS, ATPase and Fis domain
MEENSVVDYDEEAEISANPDLSNFSIQNMSADLIKKALEKHGSKRKSAAAELGISERTL